MKRNNLSKKSLLTSMIMMFTSVFHSGKKSVQRNMPNGYAGGDSPIFIPRRTRFKGYMRENRRSTFNKTKR